MNLLDFLYRLRNRDEIYWDVGRRIRYEELINKIVPVYFRMFPAAGLRKQKRKRQITVSLTTIPSRIDKVWIPVECMMRQTCRPDRIVLWLGKEEFRQTELPGRLAELQKKGLTIRFCRDVGVHTKYFYAFREYPDDYVITVDDDMYYGSGLVRKLMKTSHRFPGCICARWVWQLKWTLHNRMYPSSSFDSFVLKKEKTKPSHGLLALGVGGVLYPPGLLREYVFDIDRARKLARNADDLWLKAVELLNGVKVAKVYEKFVPDVIVSGTQETALSHQNVGQNANDRCLQGLFDYYRLWGLMEP